MMYKVLSDTELILLIIGVIYLSECLLWLPDQAVAFSAAFGRLKPAWRPAFLQRIDSHAEILSLVPWSRSVIAADWPIAVSPDGLCILSGSKSGTFISFDELKSVEADQRTLRLNRIATKFAASDGAAYVAKLLQELRSLPADQRSDVLNVAVESSFSLADVSRRLENVERATSNLRIVSLFLFLWVFVHGSVLYYTVEPHPGMLTRYLTPLGILWLTGIVLFAFAQRRLLTNSSTEQISRIATMCFSPAGVMRASSAITREAFSAFNPAAVAAVVMWSSSFRATVCERLRHLQHPSEADFPVASDEFKMARDWFRNQHLTALMKMLAEMSIAPEDLLKSPIRDNDARTWCPRCLNQYTLESGTCHDCVDISLLGFAESAGESCSATQK
ncbi:MAG: hypothetical protein O3B13_20145 [Planctomycetota bacterium]|nr:hypothetical protein [Planctomycetota bacterium]